MHPPVARDERMVPTDAVTDTLPARFGAVGPCDAPSKLGRDPTAARSGENTAAALLLLFTIAAVAWANSPWAAKLLGLLGHAPSG